MIASTVLLSLFLAQQPGGRGQRAAAETESAKPEPGTPLKEEKPSVTKHEMHLNGKTLNYTATAGMMSLKNPQGEIEANLFYVAYTLDGTTDISKRPLMFAFNGGAGA